MDDTQCRLQSEFHLRPIKHVFDIRGLVLGIVKKVLVEIRQTLWEGLTVAEHVCELLRHQRWIALIVIDPEDLIALALVVQQELQRVLPHELIQVILHVRGRPIDGLVKLFDVTPRQLNEAVSGLAIFQSLDVIIIERKIF